MIKKDKLIESILRDLETAHPDKVSPYIEYDEKLIARIQGQQDVIRYLKNQLQDKEDHTTED